MMFLASLASTLSAQQVADTTYNPTILYPAYGFNEGPVVSIDEGHHNFHTKNGRYKSFANLLERDGYIVDSYKGKFTLAELRKSKILVISNALNELNITKWYLPNPSAFSIDEIDILERWVSEGGSLFLIADHMPMAGAASDLGARFGFEFTNGFVFDTLTSGPDYFTLKDRTLLTNIITKGKSSNESVQRIVTFTGQAFKLPAEATPILIFPENYVNFLPDTAWRFSEESTKTYNVKGWSQGAFRNYGKGRVVVFGEAAMFSAQLAGPNKVRMGMNNENASQNYKLLLNIIHWLDGQL